MAMEAGNMLEGQLNWVGSSITKRSSRADVSISRVKWNKEKGKAFSFVFRNDAPNKLGSSLQIAVNKNRVFFRSSPGGVNTHTKSNSKAANTYMTIKESEPIKALVDFIGDYELKLDPYWDLYYIEKEVADAGE